MACISQPRVARNGSALGPWSSSSPTHRLFVITKSRCCICATPQRSHREEWERNFRGKCMATLSDCHESLTEIGSERTEKEYHPGVAVTSVAKGTCKSILTMLYRSLMCQLRHFGPLQHAHTTCDTFQIDRDTMALDRASTVVATASTRTPHNHGIAFFAHLPCCAPAGRVPVT